MSRIEEAQRLTIYLAQWMERYLRNKDLIHRKIQNITVSGDTLMITTKEHQKVLRIFPLLNAANLAQLQGQPHCGIATYHTEENFQALLQDWQQYAFLARHFVLYFVNPFSHTEKLWTLYPWSHHAISDEASLKLGLQSIASTVEFITIPELTRILAEESA